MRLGWKDHALCIDDPGPHWDHHILPSMFDLCMACPVRSECLMEALDRDGRDDVGVWGGTDVEQRHRIRRGKLEPEQAWQENRAIQLVAV
jgi:hypothetical protein